MPQIEMVEPQKIDFTDLNPILREHTGNAAFANALEQLAATEELVSVLGRYIHFNSVFGSGVANLAGEIGSRQDLFRDPEEEVDSIADRSVEVAANIFCAAIDEFGDPNQVSRSNHRSLAQATLKAVGNFFGLSPAELDRIARPCEATIDAMADVRNGYCINRTLHEQKIFQAIGFHVGSEVLADEEFNILDRFLRSRFPDLVKYLIATRVTISGCDNIAYRWIQIHTTIELDHFKAAVRGANLALRYYGESESTIFAKGWLLNGFRQFTETQTKFMEGLTLTVQAENRESQDALTNSNRRFGTTAGS